MWEFKITFWGEIEFPSLILRMLFPFFNFTIDIGDVHFAITMLPNWIHNLFVLSELWLTACLSMGCIRCEVLMAVNGKFMFFWNTLPHSFCQTVECQIQEDHGLRCVTIWNIQ
jgi:hypothetical protein